MACVLQDYCVCMGHVQEKGFAIIKFSSKPFLAMLQSQTEVSEYKANNVLDKHVVKVLEIVLEIIRY